MEQEFINILNTKGWLKALEEVKMPTEFWMKNFKYIPNDYTIQNALLDFQPLEEYFLAYVIKQGWMNPRGISQNDNMNWAVISCSQELSEDFMRKFKNNLDWELLSYSQKMSESFIEEFSDIVDWYHISWRQNISKEFVYRNLQKLDSSVFYKNIYGAIKL
jgi:hypothetical protein